MGSHPVLRSRRAAGLVLAFAILGLYVPAVLAHFHILEGARRVVAPGEAASYSFSFGHPFEREFHQPRLPSSIRVHPPKGPPVEISPEAMKPSADGLAWTLAYEPRERGDHILQFEAAPYLDRGEGVILKDRLSACLHVLSQEGWDRRFGGPLEIVPLSRPYGLRPGWCFSFAVYAGGKPVEGVEVETERLQSVAPKGALPEDEFVTPSARTSAAGMAVFTLDHAGWWGILARRASGEVESRDGRSYPVIERAIYWVYVGEPLRGE